MSDVHRSSPFIVFCYCDCYILKSTEDLENSFPVRQSLRSRYIQNARIWVLQAGTQPTECQLATPIGVCDVVNQDAKHALREEYRLEKQQKKFWIFWWLRSLLGCCTYASSRKKSRFCLIQSYFFFLHCSSLYLRLCPFLQQLGHFCFLSREEEQTNPDWWVTYPNWTCHGEQETNRIWTTKPILSTSTLPYIAWFVCYCRMLRNYAFGINNVCANTTHRYVEAECTASAGGTGRSRKTAWKIRQRNSRISFGCFPFQSPFHGKRTYKGSW